MKKFYTEYKGDEVMQQLVAQVPWGHNVILMDKVKDKEIRKIYLQGIIKNGWIIAQHGLHHNLSKEIRTEFCGKSFEEQQKILTKGYNIMLEHNIKPVCFFARGN